MGDRVKIVKINILPNRFGVRAIPTLVVSKDGRVVERFVGVESEEPLRNLIDAITGG